MSKTRRNDEEEDRDAVLAAFRRFGIVYPDNVADEMRPDHDFEFICNGLNLFLSICGQGVLLRETTMLGEKVRQAETLVIALEDAGNNAGLKAHQISGLDWKALRNVVLWAGDRAASKREDARREASSRYDEILHRGRETRVTSRVRQQGSTRSLEREEEDDQFPEEVPADLDAREIEKLESKLQVQRSRVEASVAHLAEVTIQGENLRGQLKLDADDSLPRFEQIAQLVEENESLKTMEKEFKSTCRKERERFLTKIEAIAAEAVDDEQELQELQETKARIASRLARARLSLAEVSRREAAEARIEADSPTREELLQFERRFAELYEQMTLKSDEHRRHLATYNALATKLKLLEDHIQLLRSIRDGFNASKNSMASAKEYRSQLQEVLVGFEKNLMRSREKVAAAERRRNEAEDELQLLLAKQRRYYRAIRELQEAVAQNDKISGKSIS